MRISDSIDPHSLETVELKALWAIDQLESNSCDRFTSSLIARYLIEKCSINTSRQAINYALSKSRSLVHRNSKGFKLMEKGRKELMNTGGNDTVIIIEANKPYSAKNTNLGTLLSSMTGQLRICDPYLDVNTLDILFKYLDKKIPAKILTNSVIDKPAGIFLRNISDMRHEGYSIEIGIYASSSLHDRYIMDNSSFWLSGNSLNHLGSKESFIVKLGDDVYQSMFITFNNRWKVSQKI